MTDATSVGVLGCVPLPEVLLMDDIFEILITYTKGKESIYILFGIKKSLLCT